VWVDDPSSALYNTWQKTSANNGQWNSAERMDIPEYNYGFIINYNTEKRVPAAGSAIFFHVSDGYTLGCTATSQNRVIDIIVYFFVNHYILNIEINSPIPTICSLSLTVMQ
jgi:L,D-peptidoglycan transpeptidase YkuD (ErfK/YbiS/YcfS/YnhG family)